MRRGTMSWSFCANRGGCWCYDPQFARVAFRYGGDSGFRFSLLGLRLVRRVS